METTDTDNVSTPQERAGRVLDNWPMQNYLELDALSSGQLKDLLVSREFWQARKAQPKASTPDMAIGTAVHALLLTPEALDQDVAVAPETGCGTRTTKTYKAWKADQAPGKALLLAHEMKQARAAANAVKEHPHWSRYIESLSGAERTITWVTDCGHSCKARVDAWIDSPDGAWLLDVKTCQNAGTTHWGARPFHYVATDYYYDLQLAWYTRAWQAAVGDVAGQLILAVEKNPPYQVRLWDLRTWMARADGLVDQALANIDAPEAKPEIEVLPMPGWLKHQE